MLLTLAQSDPESFLTAEKLTLVGTLVAVIWAIMTRRLIPGAFYEDLKRENEELRRALEQWRHTGRSLAGTAEELAHQHKAQGLAPNPDDIAREMRQRNEGEPL